ncbi:MAG: 30S ribosomal protein S17 [Phycisphaerales bacterium]|jgi:small subunit ribosomal protein S17|nr:30S ribosomal protein S17 [Phycisphaerales bacterium]
MSHLTDIQIADSAPRRVGVITSDARDKSCKVEIQFTVKHPKYGKYIRRRTQIHAHDEKNIAKLGDRVEIAECRPISKTKSWVLTKVIEEAAE